MEFTTDSGAKWNTEIPVRSNLLMVLNGRGQQEMDKTCKLTGRFETIKTTSDPHHLVEVSHSFGTDFIHEEYVWH